MAKQIEGPTLSGYPATGAIGLHLRVMLNASMELAIAGVGATDFNNEIGTTEKQAFAAGERITVRNRNAEGTRKCVADGVVAARAVVYGAAGGKVGTTVSGAVWGIALEAAAADGDIIEVLRY